MATQSSVGGLWWLDADGETPHEILNSARSLSYQAGGGHPLFKGGCTTCECAMLDVDPVTGDPVVFGDTGDAPWASAAPGAATFLGFVVDEIIGLDYSHYERTISQRALDGSNMTPLRAGGREITFRLLASSTDEAGMRYGLDWLAHELGGLSGRCGSSTVIMYLYCGEPDVDNEFPGRVMIREVALRRGPELSEVPLEGYGCILREVMFTLIANDPCYYTGSEVCLATVAKTLPAISLQTEICTNAKTVDRFLCGPVDWDALAPAGTAACCRVPVGSALETRALSVIIQNTSGTSGPFMLDLYVGPDAGTCVNAWTNGEFLGRIGVNQISGDDGVMIDGVSGLVWFRTSPSAAWTPDDSLIMFPDDEFPYFPRYSGPESLYAVLRPYYICNGGGNFTVEILSTSILGCVVN